VSDQRNQWHPASGKQKQSGGEKAYAWHGGNSDRVRASGAGTSLTRCQFFQGGAVVPGAVQLAVGHGDVDDGGCGAPVNGDDAALDQARAAERVGADGPGEFDRITLLNDHDIAGIGRAIGVQPVGPVVAIDADNAVHGVGRSALFALRNGGGGEGGGDQAGEKGAAGEHGDSINYDEGTVRDSRRVWQSRMGSKPPHRPDTTDFVLRAKRPG